MPNSVPVSRQLAADLLEIGAVSLAPEEPFQWSSGLRAPIYCDNRLTMAYPRIRRRIAGGFAQFIEEHDVAAEVVAGTATAGIPHAAWLADRLDRPMAYVRSSAKGHGRENRIEGLVKEGQSVVVIEDLISTGGSALGAVDALQAAGADVSAVLAIFTYELEVAVQAFDDTAVPLYTLTTFSTLLDVAEKGGRLGASHVQVLRDWRRDPEKWSERVERAGVSE